MTWAWCCWNQQAASAQVQVSEQPLILDFFTPALREEVALDLTN